MKLEHSAEVKLTRQTCTRCLAWLQSTEQTACMLQAASGLHESLKGKACKGKHASLTGRTCMLEREKRESLQGECSSTVCQAVLTVL